ncbi:unnamed protein product [Rhodiola kirilowii]
MSNTIPLQIPKFNGRNFKNWSIQLKAFFRSQDLWSLVETGYTEVVGEAFDKLEKEDRDLLADTRKKDQKALFAIFQAMEEPIFEKISEAETSHKAWTILKNAYKGDERVMRMRLQTLRGDFESLRMTDSESVSTYCERVQAVVNNLRVNGEALEEQRVVEKVLRSLPVKFEHVVAAIEEGNDTSKMSIDRLMSSLGSHEQRINQKANGSSQEQALQSRVEVRTRGGYRGGRGRGQGRGGGRNYNGGRDQASSSNIQQARGGDTGGRDKSRVQCYKCQKFGHYKSECRANERVEQAYASEAHGNMVLACKTKETCGGYTDVWYLDSGCSNHMSGRKELFSRLDESARAEVSFGNKSQIQVMGKGDIQIQTNDGTYVTITNVFYVPGLCWNLLSLGQLSERGHSISIRDGVCTVEGKDRRIVAKVPMTKNRMFPWILKKEVEVNFQTMVRDSSWLWHLRFGHLNFNGLKLLATKKMVTGLPAIQIPSQPCEACLRGKQHREPFPVGKARRANQPLELVHTDLCGPVEVESLGGKRYMMALVDDFSRKTWVYFLREKSEAFRTFKEFKTFVEKQSGYTLKTLRSDRGGEFTSNEFSSYCRTEGIRRQLTASYTPQQNGIAERKNRTIFEMARSMLKAKELPKPYWAEAVSCAVFLLNRCPTKAVQGKTPDEAWSGVKPDVSCLRVFGCIAYPHIPDQRRRKLDDKSRRCIFIGYSADTKGYKCYDPNTGELIVSRDVQFAEDEAWDWSQTDAREPRVDIEEEPTEDRRAPVVDSPEKSTESKSSSLPPRQRRPPVRYHDYVVYRDDEPDTPDETMVNFCLFADCDPVTFEEAAKDEGWIQAMDAEIASIDKNDTWELTTLPVGKKSIGVKWVYKTKCRPDGQVDRLKARLVVKGYRQKPGIDYFEVFAPVARMDTIRMIIALAAQNRWKIHQMDVKSAFLNGVLEEEVYVDQPPGYVQRRKENNVYKLKKALYGLKQAPRAWYARIDTYMLENEFQKCPYEHTLYIKMSAEGQMLIVCLYVDDLIFTGSSEEMFIEFKEAMTRQFEMTDMGLMSYFLGIEVEQADSGIFISQKKYAKDILKRFKFEGMKAVRTPVAERMEMMKEGTGELVNPTYFKSIVGSLRYLTSTRPDIVYGVGLISRFMEKPQQSHLLAAKRILRYISGTIDYGIMYSHTEEFCLTGYTDSDWAGDVETRKSTSGYAFYLGDGVVSWSSKKQQVVALSTAEAEYIAVTTAACQAVWLRRILEDLKHKQEGPTRIMCDNKSAIALAKNPVFHGRSKHIGIRYHYIRELVKDGEIELEFCKTDEQVADIFTKGLSSDKFELFRHMLGVARSWIKEEC